MTDVNEAYAPHIVDPDAPQPDMSSEEIRDFADKVAEMYPELVRKPATPAMVAKLTVAQWAKHFADTDRKLIDNAIRSGLIGGLDNTEIARKVIGSLQLNGIDGATEITRQQIIRLARVAVAPRKVRGK